MTQSTSNELEAKYRIIDPKVAARLRSRKTLGQQFQLGPVEHANIVDIYVDTKDARLLRAGYSLRLRHQNEQPLITLKELHVTLTPKGDDTAFIHNRLELEQPLPAATGYMAGDVLKAKKLPEEIKAIVADITGKKSKLRPYCTIKQTRQCRPVQPRRAPAASATASVASEPTPGTASPVALLSLDEVTIYNGDSFADENATPVSAFEELEAELSPGLAKEELMPVINFLSEMEGLTPEPESKYVRALIALSQVMPVDDASGSGEIEVTTNIAEALRYVWRTQRTQLLLLESGVRRDADIEYVHDMRVAIRRMRAAHLLLGRFFLPEVLDPLLSGLKRTAKVLGKVRDLDVALHKLARYGKRLDDIERSELHPLIQHWEQAREQSFRELLAWLDGKRYQQLLAKLRAFVETPGLGVQERFQAVRQPPEAVQVRHVLPAVLLERFLAVRKYEALFDAYADDNTPHQGNGIQVDTLHALRIECKYLRYALEFTPALLGQEGENFVGQLKKLQNLLGNLNDASVAKEMLTTIPQETQNGAVKRYMKKQEKAMRKIERKADHALRTFLDAENRASLGAMLGRI